MPLAAAAVFVWLQRPNFRDIIALPLVVAAYGSRGRRAHRIEATVDPVIEEGLSGRYEEKALGQPASREIVQEP